MMASAPESWALTRIRDEWLPTSSDPPYIYDQGP